MATRQYKVQDLINFRKETFGPFREKDISSFPQN